MTTDPITREDLEMAAKAAGRRVVRETRAYTCNAPIQSITLPDCVTTRLNYEPTWKRRYMQGSDGINCPKYESVKTAVTARVPRIDPRKDTR